VPIRLTARRAFPHALLAGGNADEDAAAGRRIALTPVPFAATRQFSDDARVSADLAELSDGAHELRDGRAPLPIAGVAVSESRAVLRPPRHGLPPPPAGVQGGTHTWPLSAHVHPVDAHVGPAYAHVCPPTVVSCLAGASVNCRQHCLMPPMKANTPATHARHRVPIAQPQTSTDRGL
jgi:hypothetical protein